ncbi:FAD-dependent oxidoreductase [Desulfobacterota bacterium AH_259_B03_O07]|nr:FAD-dependent oxidoreductase [Desulfobacterota bacterium AH_259_B03_O07]
MTKRIIIIGAGPTGLGAANRLRELGYTNWKIYEKNSYLGGHASSHLDENGFVWDEGGHVIFSHYKYFDDFIDKHLGEDYLEHMRESWIHMMGLWIPYPFQNNIRYLPKEAQVKCITGLINAQNKEGKSAVDFKEWIIETFGEGIAGYFMYPYNFKVWATPLEHMDKNWIAERVSVVNIKRIIENIIYERDDVSWGPNNKFKFPLYGGTGEIYRRLEPYIEGNLAYGKELVEIDLKKKEVGFQDGSVDRYDYLINTSPLDLFVEIARPIPQELRDWARKGLKHSSMFVVGIGVRKRLESNKCWMYFPEDISPFYRVTYFSNYSPNNVPKGRVDTYCSLMCEISYSEFKKENKETIVEDTINGLINTGMLEEGERNLIVSKHSMDIDYAYPTPTLERDKALRAIQPFLMENDIYSRGRFGTWKYEIGNMDHSVTQGKEAVDLILEGTPEVTWSL